MIKVCEVVALLEKWAPPAFQESYDNVGLLVGNSQQVVTGIMVCLDVTEEVLEEALREKCNLIVSHHPPVFSGLKKITGRHWVERVVIKAIKNDLNLYALHTNLDNVYHGVNHQLCHQLGLEQLQILKPKNKELKKLVTFSPILHAEAVRNALFHAGAGHIGRYQECSFNTPGEGTFTAGVNTNPFVGQQGTRHTEPEIRIEVIYPAFLENQLIKTLKAAHPYEEVAYDLYPLTNVHDYVGSGMMGFLPEALDETAFLNHVKKCLNVPMLKHTALRNKPVHKVAVCGGSGFFLLPDAKAAGADVFITSDVKYHDFFEADGSILLADAGHYETEQFTMELIKDLLIKNFNTFAIRLTKVITNPVNYI
jgi:dinuclear metal center YbgI/SA1388 family protein